MTFYIFISSLILILIIVMWFFPRSILPILILSVPLQRYSIYIQEFRFSLKLIIIFLPIAAILIYLKREFIKKNPICNNKRLIFYLLLLLTGIALSFINSINFFRSFSFLIYTCFLIFFVFLINKLIVILRDFEKALNFLVIIGTFVSLVGIMQFYLFRLGKNIGLPLERYFSAKTISAESFVYSIEGIEYLRPSSTFIDVNITAGFLSVILLLCVANFIFRYKEQGWMKALVSFLVLTINFTAFSMTVSRSAFLGMLIALLLFLIINFSSFKSKKILLLGGFLFLLTGIIIAVLDTPFDAFYQRIRTTFLESDTTGSTQEHIRFSLGAWEAFKYNPLVGIGAGNFEEYYLTNIDHTKDTAYTYNIYLSFLAETGLIGFVTQTVFIGYIIQSSILTIRNLVKEKERLLFSALFCGYIAILIANFFYAYYILFFVWLIIGLLLRGSTVLNSHVKA